MRMPYLYILVYINLFSCLLSNNSAINLSQLLCISNANHQVATDLQTMDIHTSGQGRLAFARLKALTQPFCRCLISSYTCNPLACSKQCRLLFFHTLNMQFVKLRVIYIARTFIHRRHCQVILRECNNFVD